MNTIPVVKIPKADSDSRIGEVLMSLFDVIEGTERNGQHVTWDFQGIDYLHPFFVSALAVYRDSLEGDIAYEGLSADLQKHLETMRFANPLEFNGDDEPEVLLLPFMEVGVPPVCKFGREYTKIDEMQSALFSIVTKQINPGRDGWSLNTVVSYLIGELICNIQEHSHASCGFMFVQYAGDENCLSVCIADNGITIHGSYMATGKNVYMRFIGEDHAEALRQATKGISTKNLPDNESRGYGISTNLDMVVNGLGGAFFMLSGQAFFRSDENGEQFVNLPDGMNWDGTIILVRLPLKQKAGFNVYNYIE